MPAGAGLGQRSVPLHVLLGQAGSSRRQQVDDVQVTLAGRKVQCGPTAGDGVICDIPNLSKWIWSCLKAGQICTLAQSSCDSLLQHRAGYKQCRWA